MIEMGCFNIKIVISTKYIMQQVSKSFAKMDISYSDLRNKQACLLLNIFHILKAISLFSRSFFSENYVLMY